MPEARRHAPEHKPDGTCMSIPYIYLVSCCSTCHVDVCDYKALVSTINIRVTGRHVHCVWVEKAVE